MFRQLASRTALYSGSCMRSVQVVRQNLNLFSSCRALGNGEKNLNDSDLFMKLLQVRPGKRSGDLFDVAQDIFKDRSSPLASKKGDLLSQKGINEQIGGYPLNKIPRTGPSASRSVAVNGPHGLQQALRTVNIMNSIGRVRRNLQLARYHERPGKKRWRIKNERSRRKFDAGIRHLFGLVAEARRKGY